MSLYVFRSLTIFTCCTRHQDNLLDGSIPWILWYDLPIVEIIISLKWIFFFTFVTIGGILFFFYFEKMRKKSHKPVHSMLTLFIEVQVCLFTLPVHKLPIKITKHVFVVLSSFIFIQFIFVLSIFYNILIVLTFENCKWNYKNTQSTKSLTGIQGRYSSETIWISSFFFLGYIGNAQLLFRLNKSTESKVRFE